MKKICKALGGVDMKFYQNMEGNITQWLIASEKLAPRKALFEDSGLLKEKLPAGATVYLTTNAYSPYPRKHLLDYQKHPAIKLELFVNGEKVFLLEDRIHLSSPGNSAWIELNKGWNELKFSLTTGQELPQAHFMARVINISGEVLDAGYFSTTTETLPDITAPANNEINYNWDEQIIEDIAIRGIKEKQKKYNLDSYRAGVGAGKKSAGRFGFNKGDGMLDCSMPVLGMFSKPYLFGSPKYKKSVMWHFSVIPPGIPEEDRYSGNAAYTKYKKGKDEALDVNWISVNWRKNFSATQDFYQRKKGQTINFACTYSVAAPGVIIETDDAALSLNGLESAGDYRYMLLPLKQGRTIRQCNAGDVYDRRKDGDFTDNWILIWGNTSFPDVPIMLTLQKNPEKITAKRDINDNKLSQIDIVAKNNFGWAVLQFPFGFEVFKPEETEDEKWLKHAIAKCSLQSRMALAYPVNCKEFYKLDKDAGTVNIVQKFSYRFLKDAWNTESIMAAPLPPPLGLIEEVQGLSLDPDAESVDFPTKYGPLKAVLGSDTSSYTLPLPLTRRKFRLKPAGDNSIAEMISADFNEYLDYHQSSGIIPNPGVYQFILQYAIPLMLFNFIDKDERKTLEKITANGVAKGCFLDTKYISRGNRECRTWYKRTEPFTGVEYLMSYLHISGINQLNSCSREIIENENITFNEVDWGNALALYSIYLGAMLSGNWQPVRENWETLKKAFDYFIVLQDWACMATAYREESTIWNDGTNYGAYLAFSRMAEILGDEKSYAEGMYTFAKLAALRMGIFQSSQTYFHKYFGAEPYWTSKCFNEETDASKAFINVPETNGKYRPESIYNMTTEGHYPEAWEMYSKFLPDGIRGLLKVVEKAYGSGGNISRAPEEGEFSNYVCGESNMLSEQELFSCIMMALDTGFHSHEKLLEIIDEASSAHRLSEEFLGAVLSHRKVPRKWTYCFLKSQIQGDKFPVCITGWLNLRIDSAEFDEKKATAKFEIGGVGKDAWLELELNKKVRNAKLNGKTFSVGNNPLQKLSIKEAGCLEIEFQE